MDYSRQDLLDYVMQHTGLSKDEALEWCANNFIGWELVEDN